MIFGKCIYYHIISHFIKEDTNEGKSVSYEI